MSRETLPTLVLLAILISLTASVFYATTFRGSQPNGQNQQLPNGQQGGQFNDSIQALVNGSNVIFKVRTNGTVFKQREAVTIEIVIINNSTTTVDLSTPPEAFTLRIVNSTGAEKFISSTYIGKILAPAKIAPFSELLMERYVWNQTELILTKAGSVPQRVPPGQYFIEAEIREPPSPSLPIVGNVTTVIEIR